MDITELRDKTSALKIQKQSFINDTFLWVEISRKAVDELPNTKFEFSTPKAHNPQQLRTVARNHPEKIKSRIINKDIFNSAFVMIVACVEDYLSKIIEYILQTDSERIKCTVPGVNMVNSISVIDLIDNSKEDLIDNIIRRRIENLFYASPQKQLEYLDKALGLSVDSEIWGTWLEIKARRDIIVHNNSIVNQIYLDKASDHAKFSLGEEAVIDDNYFNDTIAFLKRMIGCIDREIRKVYKR